MAEWKMSTDKGQIHSPYPHLRRTANSSQLIVHDKPFLMLGAELHNSSLSSASYMATVWPSMVAMNINTLLGAVTWEAVEPTEGSFNFTELDACIAGARAHDLHLVLLWFGSFKNAMSTYVPGWVKKDAKRFPRAKIREAGGRLTTIEQISPFCEEAWTADARAFARLMRHLKDIDGEYNTVIMVQVQNEVGLLGDSRDGSKIADQLFEAPVPTTLLEHLKEKYDELHPKFKLRFPRFLELTGNPTWEQAFPDLYAAEEIFMANAFSCYVEHVARAGRAEYDIPLYVNAWMNFDDPSELDLEGVPLVVGGGAKPGVYPSGGPVAHVLDIWRLNAPSLDFFAPDLYLQDYETVCKDYRAYEQPLFIPEQKRDEKGARRVWLAFGTYLAMGCSPFGIDSLTPETSPFTKHYALLKSISAQILDVQANRPSDIMGFYFDDISAKQQGKSVWVKVFGDFDLTIERAFVFGRPGPGAGIVIRQSDGSFLLVGWGFQVTFRSTNPKTTFTGILHAVEKVVDAEGNLQTGRLMNGDETRSGQFFIMPNEDPDYGGFPIAVTIPARSMIAEVTAYSIEEEN